MHDRGRLGKNACSKKAYKHEVPMKISQKARFEKNYIVWKLIYDITIVNFYIIGFEKNYIVWKHRTEYVPAVPLVGIGLRRTI